MYYLDASGNILSLEAKPEGEAFRASGERKRIMPTNVEPMMATSHFAVAPDGQHFFLLEGSAVNNLQVVCNWHRLLQ